jgi:serine protease Do
MKQTFNITRSIVVVVMVGLLLATGLPAATAAKNAPVRMVPQNFSVLADTVSPAVVHIRVEKTVKGGGPASGPFGGNPFGGGQQPPNFFGHRFGPERRPDFRQQGLGSGVIIDRDGYIVTNNHVVDRADTIKVILKDEAEYPAKVIGRDPVTDIALIKIEAKGNLPTVSLGSSDDLKVGEWVTAIGSPFGLQYTVTAGIVSAKGRAIGSGPYDDFIQTDASINPGNSGGPLINMKGEVVGINTMIIAGGQGIGFAIPIDMAKGIVTQLKTSGEVTRGWLGVTIQDLKGDLAEYYGLEGKTGVLVASVVPGDPADQAGIKPKDVIIDVNGQTVNTSRDLTSLAANLGVGDKAKVTILRNGKSKTLEVQIGKRPLTMASVSENRQKQKEGEYGFKLSDLTPEMARRFNLEETSGVMVVGVVPNSKADAAGIQQGDLIIEINHQNVASVKDFKNLIDQYKKADGINLLVKRMNAGLMVINLV